MPASKNSQKAFFTHNRPFFYYITDRRQLPGASFYACIRRVLKWGVHCIQIREKDLTDRALFELTRRVVDLASGTGCRILVNGRADIALAAGAHGVHLPSGGLRISDIQPWLPDTFILGRSVHSRKELLQAVNEGADYVILGRPFSTPSKPESGDPLGLEYLRKACSGISTPVFGLGGIGPDRIQSVFDAGAAGVAGIRLFQERTAFNQLKKLYPSPLRPAAAHK